LKAKAGSGALEFVDKQVHGLEMLRSTAMFRPMKQVPQQTSREANRGAMDVVALG